MVLASFSSRLVPSILVVLCSQSYCGIHSITTILPDTLLLIGVLSVASAGVIMECNALLD